MYARKSKVTETGKSIEIQKEKCIALACAKYGVTKADIEIYEDEGKSGFYADRPMYKRMLRDIESGKIRAVVCYKIDRISRRTIDLLSLVQQMEQKGIAFISVSDSDIDTSTRTGKIMVSLLAAIAEFERDIIAERISDNMYELAKEGRWLGGTCPLGYRSKKEKLMVNGKKAAVHHLEPVEEQQRAVKSLFLLFLQTSSFTGTAAALTREGYRTRQGREFTPRAVKDILQNPVYACADEDVKNYFTSFGVPIYADEQAFDGTRGIMAYNKTEQTKELDVDSRALAPKYTQRITRRDMKDWIVSVGRHKGIISGTDWILAQDAIKEIAQKSARPKESSRALLSGLVRCALCGGRMFVRAESGRKNPDGSLRFRYVCDVKYRGKGGCEKSPNLKGFELDGFIIEEICKIKEEGASFSDELLIAKKTLLVKSRETEKELDALKKRLARIDADIQSQTANLRTAPKGIRQAIYADMEALGREREEKQSRIGAIRGEMNAREGRIADIEQVKQALLDFPRLVRLLSYEDKLRRIRRIVRRVCVKGDEVHIYLSSQST